MTDVQAPANTITHHNTGYEHIAGLQQAFEAKVYNPLTDENATNKLTETHANWQAAGFVTVFTTGAFDMLHLDHAGYLLHTKSVGATALYSSQNPNNHWLDLKPTEQREYTEYALGGQLIKLIVSVDGDKSVSAKKGHNPAKGSSPRPIYGWRTRALMVASQTFIDPTDPYKNRLLPTADAVTIHGPLDIPSQNNKHHNHFDLVRLLEPTIWAIFGESKDIIDQADSLVDLKMQLHCIDDGSGTHYYTDPIIGKINTTSIINRIKEQ